MDKLILGYLAAAGLLVFFGRHAIPGAGWILALHAAGAAAIGLAARNPSAPGVYGFRHWYPLPYVASCYKEMSLLIAALRNTNYDAQLASLDYRIWGAHPTVWLERVSRPWLTETLQWLYALFVPAVLLVAGVLWRQRRFREFRYYAFLVSIGFLASYAGYLLVPARGPRFLLASLQHQELTGLATYSGVRWLLDLLESAHYDCFPSGHTELTIIAWWGSRKISRGLFWTYFVYTLSILFATVYLRYHYTVDIAAGALLAAFLLLATPYLYEGLGEPRIGRG